MTHAQVGIFAMGAPAHSYLEFEIAPTSSGLELVKATANIEMPQATVSGLNLVVGVRPSIWSSIAPLDSPSKLFDFIEPIAGPDELVMPATQRDLWLWISGPSIGQVFDASSSILENLSRHATLAEDISAWSYRNNRDLTGFIDGSANPSLLEAPDVALIPPSAPGEYGSVLLFQKWQHDLKSFGELSVEEQEKVIGRTYR